MPIVDIEIVTDTADPEVVDKETLQLLADELGSVFGSGPGETWVRLRSINRDAYAENGGVGSQARPAFVSILRAELPDRAALQEEMAGVAEVVARLLGRPRDNVHVLYAPDATGRIGFGGTLLE